MRKWTILLMILLLAAACGAGEVEPAAMQRLLRYRWPGNVRELSNVIERAVLLAEPETIRLEELPEEIRGVSLDEDEARTIQRAMKGAAGRV